MKEKPYVGQRVRLNDSGIAVIHGIDSKQMFEDSQTLTITEVGENMGDDREPIWPISVDKESINKFLIDHWDVDPR